MAFSGSLFDGRRVAVAAHVGDAEREALGDLAVDGEVPLLRARPLVGVEGAVREAPGRCGSRTVMNGGGVKSWGKPSWR